MKYLQRTSITVAFGLVALSLGCDDARRDPLAPESLDPSFAKSTGNNGWADVLQGDHILAESDAPALASTCPGAASSPGWSVVFGKTLCLIVSPFGKYDDYLIADDIVLKATVEKGKNGRITHIRLNGQDVDGAEGIWHNTDVLAVAQPVVPTKAGFTLHVHATNVPVYRYDSHLGDGNRVEMVGTISIGDVVYRPQ